MSYREYAFNSSSGEHHTQNLAMSLLTENQNCVTGYQKNQYFVTGYLNDQNCGAGYQYDQNYGTGFRLNRNNGWSRSSVCYGYLVPNYWFFWYPVPHFWLLEFSLSHQSLTLSQ